MSAKPPRLRWLIPRSLIYDTKYGIFEAMKDKIHRGSGNVFADLGLAHPERVAARAEIMLRISEIIRKRGMTQREAGALLGLPQSKISCLMSGKLSLFSLDHLFDMLNALDRDVEIVIKPKTARAARTLVRACFP
jgi:predicted XRE-type DNA-binding protein